ncbi:MAG: alpha-1,4-glucan--maltose-1-phosphate maltosyltransferase [Acidiferrobacter sp.]
MTGKKKQADPIGVDGRERIVIEGVTPVVDGGRFAVKRIVGEVLTIEADVFADGHDQVACAVLLRVGDGLWQELPMAAIGNDRWRATWTPAVVGGLIYTVMAWVDRFSSWREDFSKRPLTDGDLPVILAGGTVMIREALLHATDADRLQLDAAARMLDSDGPMALRRQCALDSALLALVARYLPRTHIVRHGAEIPVLIERERAGHGAWYEFFPRSAGSGRHGRLRDCGPRLQYAADMGFDVVYIPPIFPIGKTLRKGPNNSASIAADDVGSPWAIGAAAGGHMAVEPALGSLADFRWFVRTAHSHGLEVAMDLAFQCSPDHPYVKVHPEWFRHRADGSIQYAENPPKKYQDIYPFDFETDEWKSLWHELKGVVEFWIRQGVHIFRVDNPHTKPFHFWEWLIGEIRTRHPNTLFLAEAFTRPKVMNQLAKLGFTYSYTYFTWRTTKHQLIEYFTDLTRGPQREYFRPHLWPNTPDILPEHLQFAPRAVFMARLVLAATLAANYGIYGPAFELMENRPLTAGSEEYEDSEKYQLRSWDVSRPDSLCGFIQRVNNIRRANPALHSDINLHFHTIENDNLICYSKSSTLENNVVLVVVNLDPHNRQSGFLEWPIELSGAHGAETVQMHDLVSDARYLWNGHRHYVELDPNVVPVHIFRVRRLRRLEHDFEYFL